MGKCTLGTPRVAAWLAQRGWFSAFGLVESPWTHMGVGVVLPFCQPADIRTPSV